MNTLNGRELHKFITGDAATVEKYLKSESPSHKKTTIQMEGSVEGVAEVLLCLDLSEQIESKSVRLKVDKKSDTAEASCIGHAPAHCPA